MMPRSTSIAVQLEVITAKSKGVRVEYWDVHVENWVLKKGNDWYFSSTEYRVYQHQFHEPVAITSASAYEGLVTLNFMCKVGGVELSIADLNHLTRLAEGS